MKRSLRHIAGAALALISAYAFGFDTYRIGSRLITVGDPVSKLIALVGDPIYKEPIENRFGSYDGERWQYQMDDGVVTFTIRDTKIYAIDESRP